MSEATEMRENKGFVSEGARLVWRRQSILWWIFAVNLGCGFLGTLPAVLQLNRALHHTLAGVGLVKGFDLGMMNELARLPNVNLLRHSTNSLVFAPLFSLFMLFACGGILETYRQNRRISTAEFFEASGRFFWPFVRLMLLSLVPFTFLGGLYGQLRSLSDYVGDKASEDQAALYVLAAGIIVLALLALFVRLWFDMAKVRSVLQVERVMWRSMWKALSIISTKAGSLMWIYVRITVFAWLILLAAFLVWTRLPPTTTPITFLLLQVVVLAQLAARLWQLASATAWYKWQMEVAPGDLVDYTTPPPQEVVGPMTSTLDADITPSTEPGPGVPPSA